MNEWIKFTFLLFSFEIFGLLLNLLFGFLIESRIQEIGYENHVDISTICLDKLILRRDLI